MKNLEKIPNPVVKRLSKYLAHMQHLSKSNLKWVPSYKIARHLGLTSETIRQDLKYLDFYGVKKRGYHTTGLKNSLARLFEANSQIDIVLIGAGNIGCALVQHDEFREHGFVICEIFDSNPKKIGNKVDALVIQDINSLRTIIKEKNIKIGIIAVPAETAQQVADQLILYGIQGLLNFSPVHIMTPKSVPVTEMRMVDSLRELVYSMKQTRLKN